MAALSIYCCILQYTISQMMSSCLFIVSACVSVKLTGLSGLAMLQSVLVCSVGGQFGCVRVSAGHLLDGLIGGLLIAAAR